MLFFPPPYFGACFPFSSYFLQHQLVINVIFFWVDSRFTSVKLSHPYWNFEKAFLPLPSLSTIVISRFTSFNLSQYGKSCEEVLRVSRICRMIFHLIINLIFCERAKITRDNFHEITWIINTLRVFTLYMGKNLFVILGN